MEEMLERIKQLEHDNELLKIKIDKNTGDCEQLWTVTKIFFRPSEKSGSLRKLKLGKGSFLTVLASLVFGASNLTLRILQFFDLI